MKSLPELTTVRSIGLALARTIGMDSNIIDRATIVSTTLQQNIEQKKMKSKAYALVRKRKLFLLLHEQLKQAQKSHMTSQALYSWLSKLRDDFIERLSELQSIIDACDEESELDTMMKASDVSTLENTENLFSESQCEDNTFTLSQILSNDSSEGSQLDLYSTSSL